MKFKVLLYLISVAFINLQFKVEDFPVLISVISLPTVPYNYSILNLPAHFTTNVPGSPLPMSINGTDNTPSSNPVTDHGATLGRVLFYDKTLSANATK